MDANASYIKDRVLIDENSCWNWTKHIDKYGYGHAVINGKSYLSHRLSYEVFFGSIPDGMDIDHICFNTRCCNPDHIRALDPIENRKLQRRSFKTECVNGHSLTGENLYIRTNGRRTCRKCNLDSVNRYKRKEQA